MRDATSPVVAVVKKLYTCEVQQIAHPQTPPISLKARSPFKIPKHCLMLGLGYAFGYAEEPANKGAQ